MITRKTSFRNIDYAKLDKMAHILKSISHPVRLEIIEMLEARNRLSVAEMLEQIEVEQSLLSHHLTKMKDRGVLESQRDGRNIYYSLAIRDITKIFDCLERCNL